MADDIEFTLPTEGTTPETPASTTPIDPATGEPTLAKLDVETPVVQVEKKPDEPKAPDVEATLAVAARASKEARGHKKALEAANKELADLRAKVSAVPAVSTEKETLEAIIRNPSMLFKHGWDADKLMKNILDPSAGVEPIDPVKFREELRKEMLEEIKRASQETPEQKESREADERQKLEANTNRAVEVVTDAIKASSEKYFLVDADDSRGIVDRVTKYCISKNINPTKEQAENLIQQGIKGLHEKRVKRFGSRLNVTPQNSPSTLYELDFTSGNDKPQHRPEAKPPAIPTSSGNPLPTKVQSFEIGFTD